MMRIHTLDDQCFKLNELPDEVDDMRFAILDNSEPDDSDFKFIPMIFLESYNCPALVLDIGGYKIKMPMDWQILIGDEDASGNMEALPLTSIGSRGFKAFQYNCLSGFAAEFLTVEVVDVFNEVTWYAPKLKTGQYIAVPLEDCDQPKCVYFIKDVTRTTEVVQFGGWV